MFNRVRPKPLIGLMVSAGVAVAACGGSASASPSPTAGPPFDACLVGTWPVVGQTQNSPANDEAITYSGGAGEIFTIDASGAITIDTHSAQQMAFESAGMTFTATVAGTGKGTLTTAPSGTHQVLYFKPSVDDTRTIHSFDETCTELGPARPDSAFSAVYTCAPGRFTFYKTAVNYMVDGPIVTLKAGTGIPSSTAGPPSS